MKTFKLMMFLDNGQEYLEVDTSDNDQVFKALGITKRNPADRELTSLAIAKALDEDADCINAHDFVGCHVKLVPLLYRIVGKKTNDIMLALAEVRGLHGLDNLRGCRD